MSQPSIAVIVPTYNRAAHIGAALDSILSQTAPPEEIIVVDDGSSDDTASVLAGFGDRIRAISQANAGASAARNTGAAAAQADWLTFLDSDDLWRAERMALLRADLATAGPDIVAHVANVVFKGVGAERDFFSAMGIATPPGELIEVAEPLRLFLHSFFLIGAAFRRDIFAALGGFDTSFPTDEDTELALRMADRGPFLVRGDILAEVIRQPGDTEALSAFRGRDPLAASVLKERIFRGALARARDAGQRNLVRQALSDALLQRAEWLRGTGQGGAGALFWQAAQIHPSPVKGYAKSARSLLGGARKRSHVDRTGVADAPGDKS